MVIILDSSLVAFISSEELLLGKYMIIVEVE